jgi:hypothetical protein
MKTQMILALLVLQCLTHAFYFSKVLNAEENHATCELKRIRQTSIILEAVHEVNQEYQLFIQTREKTKWNPAQRIIVTK